jgi:hypothetical protein
MGGGGIWRTGATRDDEPRPKTYYKAVRVCLLLQVPNTKLLFITAVLFLAKLFYFKKIFVLEPVPKAAV